MANRNINGDVNVEFNEASSRQGLDSGESVKTLFGKIRKWLSDLKAVAFSGSYTDLTNKPTIPPAVAVKGNAETKYRTGNVNLTASNLGLDPLGYYGIGGRTNNTTTDSWVLVAETTALNNNNAGITLLFDYTLTEANNAASTGTGILSVSVRTNANGAIITNRSYAKWLTKMNELNNDDVIITCNNSTKSLQIWAKLDYVYKAFRVRPLSGSDRFNRFDISKWTFTTSVNTNMYESYPTGDGIIVLTPTCDIQDQLDDISEELDCLLIQAALVNDEVVIQNTSDFTDELYGKYSSRTKPKFAILELHITSNTYYYKALINCSSVRQATVMEASFITVNGTYMSIYKFSWNLSGTVGTPTVSHTSLNLGS